jgi:hypothetical protein
MIRNQEHSFHQLSIDLAFENLLSSIAGEQLSASQALTDHLTV